MNFKELNFPELLIISVNAWSDKNSTGNTISNHFGGWDSTKISNVFLRNEEIENNCCFSYFRICEKDIINSFFHRNELGVEVELPKDSKPKSEPIEKEISKFKSFLIRNRPTIILLFRELFWKMGFIRKGKLDDFLNRNKPKIIHIHCPNLIYAHRMLHYCHKVTKAKVVVFFGDEIYTYKNFWPLSTLYQSILRYWIRRTLKIADINYAATPELCDYYSKLFGKEFKVLYKGAIIEPPIPKSHQEPIKIVYAGNLLYDRWKTLSLISKAIYELSNQKIRFQLSIYTGTILSNEMKRRLNTKYSTVLGAVSFQEIKKIMKEADVVLHVETFEKKYIAITKYSFSTKIVDCIQSGSCIMGIGPNELASIHFLKQSKGALIANSYQDIYNKLKEIDSDKSILDDCTATMCHFSKAIFDLTIIREKIYQDILELEPMNKQKIKSLYL